VTDVIVIGGGVVGASAAWRLVRRGVTVTVLDQFDAGHSHGSSHGSSRIFRLAYPEMTYVHLAQKARGLWQELERETHRRVLTVTGAVDHGDPTVIERMHGAMRSAGARCEMMAPAAAQDRWPGLRFESPVLFHADGGRLFADEAVAALLAAAVARGATVRRGVRAESVTVRDDGRVEVRIGDGDAVVGDIVVVAAGGWAPGLLAGVPLPELRVTQEQTAHFDVVDPAGEWPSFIHHPAGHDDSSAQVAPAAAAVYGLGDTGADGTAGVKIGFHAIGPTVDPDHRDPTPDPVTNEQLQHYAELWLPGAVAASAVSTTCLYTLTPDHHFVVDRQGPVVVAAGFSGHGFKFGPAIGDLVVRLVLDRATTPPLFKFGDR
jgi:sarcosine oxidase